MVLKWSIKILLKCGKHICYVNDQFNWRCLFNFDWFSECSCYKTWNQIHLGHFNLAKFLYGVVPGGQNVHRVSCDPMFCCHTVGIVDRNIFLGLIGQSSHWSGSTYPSSFSWPGFHVVTSIIYNNYSLVNSNSFYI